GVFLFPEALPLLLLEPGGISDHPYAGVTSGPTRTPLAKSLLSKLGQAVQLPTLVLRRNRFGYANNKSASGHARTSAPFRAQSNEERLCAVLQLQSGRGDPHLERPSLRGMQRREFFLRNDQLR